MSNSNTNLQTQTSNALHNAIMEAGGKDSPSMLAPGNYVQWKSIIKRYIDTKPNNELIHYCLQNPPYKFKWTEKTVPVAEDSSETTTEGYMKNYKNVSQDIRDQLSAKAEAVQIILTGIDNDIYSTVDAFPNACEIWKAIERLKQGESINVQDLKTNLYWEFGKFTSRDGESLESYYSRFYKMMNELVRNQCGVTNHQVNVSSYFNYNQNGKEPATVTEDDEMSKEKEIDKLMDLISLSFKKIYKPTNNNLQTSSNINRANQDNSPRINRGTGYDNQRVVNVAGARENVGTQVVQKSGIQCYNCKEYGHVSRECQKPKRVKDAAYHKEKMLLCKQEEARVQLNAEQADWKDDTDDESDDQELEAHYMYMAQIQEVTPDPVDNSGPIFDAEPLHKVQNNTDNYNVFAIENEHPEQPDSVNDIYLEEQGDTDITIDSLDMCYDREQDDQDDADELAQERDLLASLINKLKCEIDDSKNHNKFLESSNKALVDKLKGEIEDFKTKNKSLESSNNHFKEANNELSKTNQLMFKDLKKFQAELDKYHDVNYASKDIKKELFAHQETISIQEKEAQTKFYKTREDKELDKVITLENKVKVLDDIVYKTGQSVQTMNMLNRNCKTSFAKPEFLKKAQRANPRLYDIGCYNDNLALMLAPESDETIRLDKESRSKLSDLIRPFDYDKLNNLYDLFVPQREKSPEQHYFPRTSKMSHTSSNNEFSKESFRKQTTLLEKRMDESIPWDQKCKSSKELFKIKKSVDTIFDGVERCKQTIAKRTYFGNIDPFIQNTIEGNFCPQIRRINADLENFHLCLNEEMVADLRYFNSLEHEVDTLKSQLETQKTQFLNEIDRLSREYYYADHMNAILGVYTDLDEVTNLQCDYLETLEKCEHLEKDLSKSRIMSKSFEALHKHAIKLELDLQQCKEKIKNDKSFKENKSKKFLKQHEQYFEIQDLKAQLQGNEIAISELKKLIEKMKGKSVETKTRQPIDVPISTREPKHNVNHLYNNPVTRRDNLFMSTCAPPPKAKNHDRNLRLLTNFVEKFLGTVKFGNDQIAPILGYGDLVQGTITIKRVYYIEGLNHNLFSVGQFCDLDLEVAFRKSTCYIRDLKGNDLLTGSHGTDINSITLQDTPTPNLICLIAKATSSQAWLWHRHLFHLNFDTINLLSKNNIVNDLPKLKFVKDHLCSSCKLGKAKRKCFHTKTTPSSKRRLQLLHMDLCSPMRVESINGKKYVLVIVDDYFRYTWTHFLRSKDETPEVLIDFLTLIQRGLHAQVRTVRTDKGTEFLNKTLHAFFAKEGIRHETSTARTPEQNGIVKRRNRTLVEAARTMLSAAKIPLFFWAEAIATTCFTQNRSLVIPRHEKTPYHIINARKPSVKFFYIFGSLYYIDRDGENLDKMKEKGNACIFVGYSTQSRAYRVFNKRTRIIVETIHVNFDELPQMASDHVSSDPVPQGPTTVLEQDSLSPGPQSQENVPQVAETVTTSNELDLLFSLMFDELLNGTTLVVSKSFAVHAADALNKHQQQHTTPSTSTTVAADTPPLNIQTTPVTTSQAPTQVPIVTATENIIQVETNNENAQVDDDEFVDVFSTPVQDRGETSCHHVDSSNMHTFYQHNPSAQRWTKDHPLEQVIGNPSQSIRTRRQLEIYGKICMFALTVSRTELKNIKEAMADSAWIESMQEELH
ncbi:retrovirus-related pol polyprotein from transposon TNT 1-94 [Tanacetum coccineum]|uniref:Retrovirus-related pol polyprotein from transposon TNT 1-94 n=1 Tax=Tanacetum coccineum TaxID=301880 RepID=A0ABQ4Y6I3_9ASTR